MHRWMTMMMKRMTRMTWRRSWNRTLTPTSRPILLSFVSSLLYRTVAIHLSALYRPYRTLLNKNNVGLCHP
jgi:hypothetical protein